MEENVRIYHDLGYILVICEYLQHKILECLRRRAKPTDAYAAACYCLQVSLVVTQFGTNLMTKLNSTKSQF